MSYDWLNSQAAAPYYDTIVATASKYNIDPSVLANQIGAESSFNPNAISSTGAQGLAQVLPSTAANPGYGVSPLANPFDPASSIDFAAQYTIARGGYNAQGLSNYSGGSYSDSTVNNILGGAGASAAGGGTSPSASPPSSSGGTSGAGATSPSSSGGLLASAESFLSQAFVVAAIFLLGLIFVAVGLTMFGKAKTA